MASGLISMAYTVPVSRTRFAARTVNQPDPAPISATVLPGAIPRMSMTRLICSLSSLPGESKMERSPVYGLLVLRCSDCCVAAGDSGGDRVCFRSARHSRVGDGRRFHVHATGPFRRLGGTTL